MNNVPAWKEGKIVFKYSQETRVLSAVDDFEVVFSIV